MARFSRKLPRFARTLVISRRGGSSSAPASSGVTATLFMSSAFEGKPDLQLSIVNGAVESITPKTSRDWELFDYAAGLATALSAGFGWNGAALLPIPYATRVAEEQFETYPDGTASGASMTGGSGWSAAPIINAY